MKKRVAFLFSMAALVTGSAAVAGAPPFAPKGPGFHGQQVTASAGGGVCGQHGDSWRCRSFSVSEYRGPTGPFSETRVLLEQTLEADLLAPAQQEHRVTDYTYRNKPERNVEPPELPWQIALEHAGRWLHDVQHESCVRPGGR